MEVEDLPGALEIEQESFSSPWTAQMFRDEMVVDGGWRRVAVDEEGTVEGFFIGRRYPDAWHVMDLAVSPRHRHQGVGRLLLRRFLEAADLARVPVFLEVRESNKPALALYDQEGFAEIGRRAGYYSDSHEDAVVMVRDSPAARAPTWVMGPRIDGPLLAVESSCDDSAAAVITSTGEVQSSVVHSQNIIHQRYGGVVPEVASRAHVERMTVVIREALREAECGVGDLGGVGATVGPGLIGALLVGVQTAKSIAWSRRLPFFPVNHIHGHLAAVWLADPEAPFPMITLVASGGHTALIRMDSRTTYQLVGQTLDDAAGEAFDKGARLLGLGYPGGKELDELSEKGDSGAFSFPIGLKRSQNLDFSFSGVKTALYYLLRDMNERQRAQVTADVAASYREAIVGALVSKTLQAARRERVKTLAAVGGVASNSLLRRRLSQEGQTGGFNVVLPPPAYCTDNAAMIGAAALCGPMLEYPEYLGVDASSVLPL